MESLPYRPLKKIVAPKINKATSNPSSLEIGDKVRIYHGDYPNGFWREYEVTTIDGDECRLASRNKKFVLFKKVNHVVMLIRCQRELSSDQSQLQPSQSAQA